MSAQILPFPRPMPASARDPLFELPATVVRSNADYLLAHGIDDSHFSSDAELVRCALFIQLWELGVELQALTSEPYKSQLHRQSRKDLVLAIELRDSAGVYEAYRASCREGGLMEIERIWTAVTALSMQPERYC